LTTNNTGVPRTNTYTCTVYNSFGTNSTFTVTVGVQPDPTAPYPVAVLADKPVDYFRLNEADTGFPNNGVTGYDYAGGYNGSYNQAYLGQPGYNMATDGSDSSAAFAPGGGNDSYLGNVATYLDLATPN